MIADPSVLQAQPLPNPRAIIGSDEILGHVDRAMQSMPPEAQGAVSHAHDLLGLNNPLELAQSGPSTPASPAVPPAMSAPADSLGAINKAAGASSLVPGMVGVERGDLKRGADGNLMAPAPSQPSPMAASPSPSSLPPLQTDSTAPLPSLKPSGAASTATAPALRIPTQADSDLMRVTGRGENPREGLPGYRQIHNPFVKTLAGIGDVIGSGFFPGLTQFIPGTSAHHNLQVVPQAEQAVADEQRERADDLKAGQEAATTRLTETQIPHVEAETAALGNPKDEFALFHKQNPNGTVTDFVKQQEDGKNPTSPYQIWHKEPANAGKGYIDFLKAESGTKPPTNELELYIRTHPDEANPLAGFEHEKQNLTAHPLTKETAAVLNANYNTLAKQYKGIPLDQFHEGMTSAEATQIKAAMLGAIAGTQKGQTVNINQGKAEAAAAGKRDAETSKEFVRVNKRLTTGYDKLQSQMDNLEAAEKEISGSAPAQALGVIKSIVATAGGQGSGVRITQAELNSLTKARNLGDSFEAWMQKFTSGKSLAPDQVAQIKDMLHGIRQTADAKHQMYLESLDKLNAARSVQEVRQIESDFNHAHGANDDGPKQVTTQAEYNALPSGTKYVDANGNKGTKK